MKGKITQLGKLQIDCAGEMKPQFCQYDKTRLCGDDCVLFGEPRWLAVNDAALKLCQREYYFTNFIDERGKHE